MYRNVNQKSKRYGQFVEVIGKQQDHVHFATSMRGLWLVKYGDGKIVWTKQEHIKKVRD